MLKSLPRHLQPTSAFDQRVRMALMRVRMPASSCSHCARSAGVGQHGGDDLRAVDRRVGVVGADHDLQLRQHARRFVGAFADHAERADALAVEREALRKRGRDEEVQAAGDEQADRRAVFGQPEPKPW